MRQILHFIDHKVMQLNAIITAIIHLNKNIVN